MKPIRIGSASRIEIGYDGENGARAVVFDATKWMEEMPGCTAAITAQRADGQEYIAPEVTQDEEKKTITWTLTSAETMEGEGRAQLLWMDGERIAKQAIFTTVCHESLKSDATEIGVPEPVWAQKSLAAARKAEADAGRAEAAAARAEAAEEAVYAPSASAERVEGGVLVTVTDKTGTTSAVIRDGERGETGPKGDPGPQGEPGPQGIQGPAGADGKETVIDATLTQAGQAADAKATGDAIGQLKNDLNEITIKNPSTESILPVWNDTGSKCIQNGQVISYGGWVNTELRCLKGEVYDISIRTAIATSVQPILLTKKSMNDSSFNIETDVIYAKNLEADLNPYTVTIEITEDCFMWINRKQNNTSFPCVVNKTTYTTYLNPDVVPKDEDELNIYKLSKLGNYSDDTVHEIKKTDAGVAIQFVISDVPASNRMMLAYKIKPLFMDCETFNYNFVGNFYRNRNVKTLKRTDVGKELQVYTSLELFGSVDNYIALGFALGTSTLQGQSVKSIYTNGIEREFLSDAEDVIRFQIYDVRLIDFSRTKKGYEVSTNYEYQMDDIFADRLFVNKSEYVKHERSIYGFGDSLMMSGKYREKSWIENLYLQGYKLNISYDKNNNGMISNKTINSAYHPTSFTEGFVNKIVKDTVQVGDDITIFALGIHDYSQNLQGNGYGLLGKIGVKELDGNYNWCTVAGAVETILKKVTSNANRRILWVNVAHNRYGVDTDVDYSLREENNIIEQACKNWGVPVSDVYGKMGMNASNVGGNNIWDGQYTDNMKYDDSGNLVSDELYFVTSKVAVSDQKQYTTLWVSSGSNGCYMSCFGADGSFIRNNAPKWSILPSGTTHIVYNVPKASSVEAMTTITNSFTNGFICDVDEAMTTDAVHLTDKSYIRYLNIINEDVKQLILQDE